MLLLPLIVAMLQPAQANERRFTTTYETNTLPKGVREIEPWTTISFPRAEGEGLIFKERMELEVGLTDRLQTAWYLNWAADTSGAEFSGVSSEWKLNLMSRATRPVGVALYGEVGAGPSSASGEAKLLLDKEMGGLVVAYNLVGELEFEREEEVEADGSIHAEWEREVVIENRLAASHKSGAVSYGVEVQQDNEFHGGVTEIKLGAGPVVGWAGEGMWAAMTLPIGLVEASGGVVEVSPAVDLRLILGFDF